MDATIIEASRGKTTDGGLGSTRQKAATYTQKHGRTYHGYKAHIATDGHGMIKDYVYDTASVHDPKRRSRTWHINARILARINFVIWVWKISRVATDTNVSFMTTTFAKLGILSCCGVTQAASGVRRKNIRMEVTCKDSYQQVCNVS